MYNIITALALIFILSAEISSTGPADVNERMRDGLMVVVHRREDTSVALELIRELIHLKRFKIFVISRLEHLKTLIGTSIITPSLNDHHNCSSSTDGNSAPTKDSNSTTHSTAAGHVHFIHGDARNSSAIVSLILLDESKRVVGIINFDVLYPILLSCNCIMFMY